ncbi:sulfur globule family protein [Sanguibacter massiliensis]|uniref:sulfur globule family protein n=1 Tax=Sanguibacter massiliensis TaxID=1973217 RepID=UPI00101AE4C1|nr:sulfur globule family protein [Sanguibacter massiliensis]
MDENVGGTPLGDTTESAPAENTAPRGRFDDITDGDHVRDLLGVVAIVLALQLPWSAAGGATDVPWALASLLLLVVPLALPYLARLGALPAAWTVHSTRRARVLLALPTAAAAIAQIVLDAASVDGHRGVGAGVGIALTAAALAAVPRACELGPVELDGATTRSWRATTLVVGILAALAPVAWLTLVVVQRLQVAEPIRKLDELDGLVTAIAVTTTTVLVALVLPAVLAAFTGTALWRRASVVVAATWAAVLFASGGTGASSALESVRTLVTFKDGDDTYVTGIAALGFGLVLVGVLAALTTSPAVVRAAKPEGDPAIGWFVTARGLLALLGALAGVLAAVTLVVAIDDRKIPGGSVGTEWFGMHGEASPGLSELIPGAVVALVLGGVALKVRSMLVGRPADARRPALAATAALLGLGIVLVVVSRLDEASAVAPAAHVGLLTLVLGVGLPVAVLACLTLPSAVRSHIAANPATPRPGGVESAFVWRPQVAALRSAPAAPAPSAPSAQGSPAASYGYPQAPGPAYGVTPAPVGVTQRPAPAGAPAVGAPGYGAPAEQPAYGAPAGQPAYGAPAGQPAYGAPAGQPAYGAPAGQPAYGAPAAEAPGSVPEAAPAAEVATGSSPVDGAEAEAPSADAGTSSVDLTEQSSGADAAPAGEQITEVLRLDDAGAAGVSEPSTRAEAGFTWAQAIDPQTSATTLAQIAQDAPTLRAALAANPSTYPALLEWLGQLGDAEVDDALRSRTA